MARANSHKIDRLAAELASMDGEGVAKVLRKALEIQSLQPPASAGRIDREQHWKEALADASRTLIAQERPANRPLRAAQLRGFLEKEIWPHVPPAQRGRMISKKEREDILGYGAEGA